MGVYKRGNDWWIDYYAYGVRKREKIGIRKSLAALILKKRKVEVAEGTFLDKRKINKIKFKDFGVEFVNLHSKPNKKSWKSDVYNLKVITPFLNGKCLHEITTQNIEKFKSERIKQVAPATVNRELATIKTLFNKAIAWGKVKESPATNVKFLKEPKGRLRFLEIEEINRLLFNASDKLKPILIVALNTGMRRGEIFGLKWHDIDFRRDIIHLFDTKNGDSREIPMNKLAKKTLVKVRKHPDSSYVFCNKDGQPLHDVRKSFWKALKESDITDFRFHDLRHTYASQLVMAGVDINTTRELLGHKDIRMTLKYAHLSPSHKKRAVDVLGSRMDTIWTPKNILEKSEKYQKPQLVTVK